MSGPTAEYEVVQYVEGRPRVVIRSSDKGKACNFADRHNEKVAVGEASHPYLVMSSGELVRAIGDLTATT